MAGSLTRCFSLDKAMHPMNHSNTHSLFYFQSIADSPYLLEPLIDRIASEQSADVKLQLLTATMKLFFKKSPECQHMLGRLLKFCVGEFIVSFQPMPFGKFE